MKTGLTKILSKLLRTNVHPDFTKLFLEKEWEQILGKHKLNIIFLIIILTLTFIAIGFANGSLEYLGKKMNDPFVRFINIEIPRGKTEKVSSIQFYLNNDSLAKKEYSYSEVTGFNKRFLYFKSKLYQNKSDVLFFSGRTIPFDDRLLTNILNKENLIVGRSFRNNEEFGLIVTLEMLQKLHLHEDLHEDVLYMPLSLAEGVISPLPVVAVVKELPGMNEFAVTPYFHSQWMLSESNPFNPIFTKYIILFAGTDSTTMIKIRGAVEKIIDKDTLFNKYDPELDVVKNDDTYKAGFNFIISFLPKPPDTLLNKMSARLLSNRKLESFKLIQIFRFNPTANSDYKEYDYLSVHFSNLDHIRGYRNYLYSEYGLGIDMAKVESMENYNFITQITRIISFLLIVFSILSICLFVGNLLSKHLERIHMNIGTFKAFGIDNRTLYKIYLLLAYLFIMLSTIFSLILSWLFGISGSAKLILSLFAMKLEENSSYFKLFDQWTLIAIILTLSISYIVLIMKAGKILNKTPGDLIYSRL